MKKMVKTLMFVFNPRRVGKMLLVSTKFTILISFAILVIGFVAFRIKFPPSTSNIGQYQLRETTQTLYYTYIDPYDSSIKTYVSVNYSTSNDGYVTNLNIDEVYTFYDAVSMNPDYLDTSDLNLYELCDRTGTYFPKNIQLYRDYYRFVASGTNNENQSNRCIYQKVDKNNNISSNSTKYDVQNDPINMVNTRTSQMVYYNNGFQTEYLGEELPMFYHTRKQLGLYNTIITDLNDIRFNDTSEPSSESLTEKAERLAEIQRLQESQYNFAADMNLLESLVVAHQDPYSAVISMATLSSITSSLDSIVNLIGPLLGITDETTTMLTSALLSDTQKKYISYCSDLLDEEGECTGTVNYGLYYALYYCLEETLESIKA